MNEFDKYIKKPESITVPELHWTLISYTEEHDCDGSTISSESIIERPYRGGYLVQSCWENYQTGQVCREMTFVKGN